MSVYVISDFISKEECSQINELLESRSTPTPRYNQLSTLGWPSPLEASKVGHSANVSPDTENLLITTTIKKVLDLIGKTYEVEDISLVNAFYQVILEGGKHQLHCDSCEVDGSPFDPNIEEVNDWSGVLYLNSADEDFTGGEISFPKQDILQKPVAGTLVYFKSDVEHPHEVLEVLSGKRKCLAIFTGNLSKIVRSDVPFYGR